MNKRTDRLTAVQVDLAVNIAAAFGMAAGVLSLHTCFVPLPVIQRVLIQGGPDAGLLRPGLNHLDWTRSPHTGTPDRKNMQDA